MAPKSISQQAFDEMVQENIDALGLKPEEALSATIEELQLQGVDLSSVVKSLPGASRETPPIGEATKALSERPEERRESLLQLQKLIESKEDAENITAVVLQERTLNALLDLLGERLSVEELQLCCHVMCLLLNDAPALRAQFLQSNGPDAVIATMARQKALGHPELHQGMAALLGVVVSACRKCEAAKCKFMDPDFVESLHSCLKDLLRKELTREPSVSAPCSVFMALTNPDDRETSASQTFMHARLLANQKVHLTVLNCLKQETQKLSESEVDAEGLLSCLNALRCLAANDEICKEICEADGIAACLEIFTQLPSHLALTRATCNALRQLSCSDAVKAEIMKLNGAAIFANLLAVYSSNGVVFEGLLGLMTLITLRQPQFAKAFCDHGCHEAIHHAFHTFSQQPKVLRQCCACLRNFAVRDASLKQTILQLGVESAIRDCKARFPKDCHDDASSALRDLGFDDYQ